MSARLTSSWPLRRVRKAEPYWFLVITALLTVLTILAFRQVVKERDESRFRNATETVADSIRVRLDAYLAILVSTRSLFLVRHDDVDLPTFRRFVAGLDLERRYPGIQGIGFTRRIRHEDVGSVIARTVREGQEPFQLWPDEARDEHHAIVFLEPPDRRNRAALGFDMSTEAVRWEAMARARDTGRAAASGRVTLVQEIDPQKQAGFLLYVPVYRGDEVPNDVASRRERLVGFVYAAFRFDDLMRGIFGSQRAPYAAFDVYDGPEPGGAQLVFRGIEAGAAPPPHSAVVHLDIDGRPWTLRVVSTDAFDLGSSWPFVPYLVAIGLLVNYAFFVAIRAQVRAQRDETAAHQRLSILAETSKRLSEARLEVSAVLKAVCQEVAHRLTESCTLTLLDPTDAHLELAETAHLDPEAEASLRRLLLKRPIPFGERWFGHVAATVESVLMPVVPDDLLVPPATPADIRDYLVRFPVSSLIVVPLRLGERVIGTLSCSRGPGAAPFTATDQQLLQEIADRAAFAVENARLAERLSEAVKLRDDFLSIAGHELKTPLTALQLQVDGVLHQTEKGAMGEVSTRLVGRLSKVQTLVGRLEVLIGGLLDVSRIAAGKLLLQTEEVDLRLVLSDVVDRFGEHFSRAGCEVSIEAGGDVVGQWDRLRLDQVFTNLVSNALKYGAGKPIAITVARDSDHARVAIRDHGIGIAPEDRGRIFDRFERAVSERNYAGLGLGLWITQQIVSALGGTIELESEVGIGSTFRVDLPLHHDARCAEGAS